MITAPPLTLQAVEWWHALVLGIVEGLTEYLPVSSTGHLILAASFMGLDRDPTTKAAVDAFNIVIQGGAILAVLGLYRARVGKMIAGLLGKDPDGRRLAINIIIAFLPAACLGVVLDDDIGRLLFHPVPVLAALAVGGIYMLLLDKYKVSPMRKADAESGLSHDNDLYTMTWKSALIIGFMQVLAMWPGTSRSMMTITAGVLVGLRPRQAAEFSFLLGLPTLGGACVYKLYKDVTGDGPSMFEVVGLVPILIGIAAATASAVVAVSWLVGFLNRHGLALFGWYRLVLCVVLGSMIAAGVVQFGPDA
jgi:undecaprenyl-diphosphatase